MSEIYLRMENLSQQIRNGISICKHDTCFESVDNTVLLSRWGTLIPRVYITQNRTRVVQRVDRPISTNSSG